MKIEHIDYTGETVNCGICLAEMVLPRDERTWPKKSRVLYGKTWLEVSPVRRRPDGSMGFVLPPKLDVLVEFVLQHRACAGDTEPLPPPPPPPRIAGTCILGPVTIVPDEVYRIIVADNGARERREFPSYDEAMAGIEAAQEELAHKHEGGTP